MMENMFPCNFFRGFNQNIIKRSDSNNVRGKVITLSKHYFVKQDKSA